MIKNGDYISLMPFFLQRPLAERTAWLKELKSLRRRMIFPLVGVTMGNNVKIILQLNSYP